MAEIYSSSDAATLSSLSQEASDHINHILADLGLSGTSSVVVQSADANKVTATADHQVVIAATSPDAASPSLVDDGGHSVNILLANSGSVHLTGRGEDTVFASDGGNAITAGGGTGAIHGGAGNDSISGGMDAGSHLILSGGGHDTLIGGNGMDTLWGGGESSFLVGGTNGHTALHAGTGGDNISSAGGFDTIYGGHATIVETGGNSVIYTDGDTVSAQGHHDLVDGSASTQGSTIDVFGHHSTILGGAGNDTITLHDGSSGWASVFGGAGNDTITGSMGGNATLSGGTGDDHFFSFGMSDSMAGGDGSDVFGIAHAGAGHDTIDGGSGHNSIFFDDRALADAHIATSDTSMVVSFDDGYSATISNVEQLHFKDSVYNV